MIACSSFPLMVKINNTHKPAKNNTYVAPDNHFPNVPHLSPITLLTRNIGASKAT